MVEKYPDMLQGSLSFIVVL